MAPVQTSGDFVEGAAEPPIVKFCPSDVEGERLHDSAIADRELFENDTLLDDKLEQLHSIDRRLNGWS